MSVIMLTLQERSSLEQAAATAILTPVARRAQALVWLADGDSFAEVATRLAVSRQTVYNWVESFVRRRRDVDLVTALRDKPRSGRPPRRPRMVTLSTPQALDQMIMTIIDRDPRECGYHSLLWTAKLLRQYLQEVDNMKVTVASVRSALTRLETRWQPERAHASEHAHDQVA